MGWPPTLRRPFDHFMNYRASTINAKTERLLEGLLNWEMLCLPRASQ